MRPRVTRVLCLGIAACAAVFALPVESTRLEHAEGGRQTSSAVARKNKFGSAPKERGHRNEMVIAERLRSDREFRRRFFERLRVPPELFSGVVAEGKTALKEVDLFCGHVNGKTDMVVQLTEGEPINVSVKMSPSGQVYLVSAAKFAGAYEALYGEAIPPDVVRALKLFTGEAEDSAAVLATISPDVDRAYRRLEQEQNSRLFYDAIHAYDPHMAEALLTWLRDHAANVFELCFAAGTVKDRKNWSQVLWYQNLLEGGEDEIDYLVEIQRVKSALEKLGPRAIVKKGPRGGSTIHLPFGAVQYHLGKLEFRHSMTKIRELLEE